jgi:ATP-dependent Clp protease ATP-binding subunit ClpA
LKRVIQRELQNPLAERILAREIRDGDGVGVTATALGLVITPAPHAEPATARKTAAE